MRKAGITLTNRQKSRKLRCQIKRSSFLIVNDNQHGYTSDEENTNRPLVSTTFTIIQEADEADIAKELTDIDTEEGSTEEDTDVKYDELTKSEGDKEDDDCKGLALSHKIIVCYTQDMSGIPKNSILLDVSLQ